MPSAPISEVQERLRRRAEARAVRAGELVRSLGAVLDVAVQELQEQGTTVISLPPAVLSARIVRCRWGDGVLEVDGRKGTGAGATKGSRTRLGRRQTKDQEAETVSRYLSHVLADLTAST